MEMRRVLLFSSFAAVAGVTLAAVFRDHLGIAVPFLDDVPPVIRDLPGEPCATSAEGATYGYANARNVGYTLPNYESRRPSEQYWEGLRERLTGLRPIIVTDRDALSSDELRLVRDKLFGAVIIHFDERMLVGPDGQCARPVAAMTDTDHPHYPGQQVMREFPRMQNALQERYDFYMGHETGHLLDRVLNLQHHFNNLTPGHRAFLYQEMEAFQKFLEASGRSVNATRSGPEGIADAVSYLLREPALVRAHAPGMYQFLVAHINAPDSPVKNLITIR